MGRIRFVVTGTGRSGTGYAAELFTAAGLPCGHEDAYRAISTLTERGARPAGLISTAKEPLRRARETVHRWGVDLEGDSSWMAAPRLARFRGVSFLQTRHPLPVIRSFMGLRFFSEPERHGAYFRYAASFFEVSGDDVVDAMRWWVFWNDLAAKHATHIYRLEDLDESTFGNMLELVGVPDGPNHAARVFGETRKDVNSSKDRGDQPGAIGWDDLPAGPVKDRLQEAMARYGYAVEHTINTTQTSDATAR